MIQTSGFKRSISALFCLLILQPWFLMSPAHAVGLNLSPQAAQLADIIGIRRETEAIVSLHQNGPVSDNDRNQLNSYRALVFRKILQAVLEVQNAENRLEMEMAYTYDVLAREQRKINTVNQLFTSFNFLQFGIIYTIQPRSRIHKQFKQSAILGSIASGVGLGLPVINIFYNKYFAKAHNVAPPEYMAHMIDGKPVDGSNLPLFVKRYFDFEAPGTNATRRELLNEIWKKRYHADLAKKETLAGIDDKKSVSTFVLNRRIVLLWSMYTAVQSLNKDLLSLLNQVRGTDQIAAGAPPSSTTYSGSAEEAARLLKVEPLVAELNSLNSSGVENERTRELRLTLCETILAAFLDMQLAADRCQEELNYQYDVVLAQMTARRGKFLQNTYRANFIQQNTLGEWAAWSYMKNYNKAGNELLIIAGAIGLAINTISLLATHGGWKKNESPPNSLAEFFNLETGATGFSPLVSSFLNSASARSGGKSRRQYLNDIWSDKSIAHVNLDNPKTRAKLGSMPSAKWDTIRLVRNRIALLNSLREQFGQFDSELLALLKKSWPKTPQQQVANAGDNLDLNPSAAATSRILGVEQLVVSAKIRNNEDAKMLLTRDVFEAFLDTTASTNVIANQIIIEEQVLDGMIRQRDTAIQLTSIANFYQLGVLGITALSLGLCKDKTLVLYGNRVNIVAGLLVSCLAMTALLERHGGIRMSHTDPNALGLAFGKDTEYVKLSPLLVRYLDSSSTESRTGLTRRQDLVKYWTDSKVLSVNVKNDSVVQRLVGEGKAHHWWNETIKLISNRVFMLYDLRATLRGSNTGFSDLLKALD